MSSPSCRRVLVVDADALMRWAIAETLTHAGYAVVGASDGASAIRVLADSPEPIDAVVLDYGLPYSGDSTLLARIRRLAPRSPVILMTAFSTRELITGARDLGAYEVLNKPFELRHLETVVDQACALQHYQAR
jgi:DNA-binding NtrC family response regulator